MAKHNRMVALVTGAGSGIGRAAAYALADKNFSLVLVGRDEKKLEETSSHLPADVHRVICACDISTKPGIESVVKIVTNQFGRLDVLVNGAGVNVPKRSLQDCEAADYDSVIATNLSGAFLLTKAFLPLMRAQEGGTIINVISDSGLRGNNFAGVAYISSKFGLRGLTEAINAEERHNGIRATAIYPGEVNTPILDKRPVPPNAEARELMLQPDDVAQCIALAATLPPRAIVEDLVIRPAVQDWVSRK